jgi:hypothetical protein
VLLYYERPIKIVFGYIKFKLIKLKFLAETYSSVIIYIQAYMGPAIEHYHLIEKVYASD